MIGDIEVGVEVEMVDTSETMMSWQQLTAMVRQIAYMGPSCVPPSPRLRRREASRRMAGQD
jgi:hypothetical protein